MSKPAPCTCSAPGYCQRYDRQQVGRLYELCSGNCPAERSCTPEQSEAYRRLWDQQRRGVRLPPFLRRLRTFLRALLRHAADRFRRVPQREYDRRLAICRACPQHSEEKGVERCQLCGCGLKGTVVEKLRWSSERCPKKSPEWIAYVHPASRLWTWLRSWIVRGKTETVSIVYATDATPNSANDGSWDTTYARLDLHFERGRYVGSSREWPLKEIPQL